MIKAPKRLQPCTASAVQNCRERAQGVLFSIHWSRTGLSTTQIRRLYFPSPRTTQRTVRKLLDWRLVKAHLQGGALHRDNVYTLTRLGAELLRGRNVSDARPTRMPRGQRLQHSLAIRDVGIAAVLAAREGKLPLVEVKFEEDLAREEIFRSAHLLPDAMLGFRSEDDVSGLTVWVGVELCLETEGESVLRKKIAAWRTVFHRHRDLRGLFIVAQTERRVDLFRRLCAESGIPSVVTLSVDVDATIRESSFRQLYARPVRAERIEPAAQVLDITSEAAANDMAFIPL